MFVHLQQKYFDLNITLIISFQKGKSTKTPNHLQTSLRPHYGLADKNRCQFRGKEILKLTQVDPIKVLQSVIAYISRTVTTSVDKSYNQKTIISVDKQKRTINLRFANSCVSYRSHSEIYIALILQSALYWYNFIFNQSTNQQFKPCKINTTIIVAARNEWQKDDDEAIFIQSVNVGPYIIYITKGVTFHHKFLFSLSPIYNFSISCPSTVVAWICFKLKQRCQIVKKCQHMQGRNVLVIVTTSFKSGGDQTPLSQFKVMPVATTFKVICSFLSGQVYLLNCCTSFRGISFSIFWIWKRPKKRTLSPWQMHVYHVMNIIS